MDNAVTILMRPIDTNPVEYNYDMIQTKLSIVFPLISKYGRLYFKSPGVSCWQPIKDNASLLYPPEVRGLSLRWKQRHAKNMNDSRAP